MKIDVHQLEFIKSISEKLEGYSEGDAVWVPSLYGDDAACSICGQAPYDFKVPFQCPDEAQECPCCGAKMKGVNYGWFRSWDDIKKGDT